MSSRLLRRLGALAATSGLVAAFALSVLTACEEDERKDQNYGSDLGANYGGPEAGAFQPDASRDASTDALTDAFWYDANDSAQLPNQTADSGDAAATP